MQLRPYPEYKESGQPFLGKIPAHWDVFRNGRLFSQRNETGFGELPILEVSLKTGVRVRDMDNLKRKQVMADREKYKRAAQGDLAYNMMRMWQGAIGVAPVDGLVSPAYVVVRPFPEMDCRYFSYLFRTTAYMNEVDAYSRGIVKDRNRLYWQDFKRMPSVVPPVAEQRQIVRFLNDVGAKIQRFIRNKRRLIKLLKDQKQHIINQAVTRGINPNVKLKPSGVEWIGDIPAHWEVRKLKHIAAMKSGDNLTSEQIVEVAEYPVYGGNGLRGYFNRFNKEGKYLLVGRQGALCGNVHRVDGKFWATEHAVVTDVNHKFSVDWYYYMLTVMNLNQYSESAAQPGISVEKIQNLRTALPSLEEQKTLVSYIEKETATIDYTITRTEREIELMREYRDRLIADVVTGQVDVRGIEVPEIADEELLAVEEDATESDDVIDADEDLKAGE
jgi:type I restriction enzyme S subunit